VLFAHGLALADQTYPRFLHDLAASGFVVADPEFPLSSGALPGPARSDPVDQAADLAFVADQLLDPATRPEPLRTVTFLDHLVVIGHSDGGITAAGFAANSCCADPRVGAVVVLAGALGRFSGGWFTTVAAAARDARDRRRDEPGVVESCVYAVLRARSASSSSRTDRTSAFGRTTRAVPRWRSSPTSCAPVVNDAAATRSTPRATPGVLVPADDAPSSGALL
jgi:alpha-beta hydrolase superfamily lysophospholipase